MQHRAPRGFVRAHRLQEAFDREAALAEQVDTLKRQLRDASQHIATLDLALDEAQHDYLTGALTRRAWTKAAEAIEADYGPGAIVFADVDNLKSTNDRYGHSVGDLVLYHTVQHLMRAIHDPLIGRIGADEFVVWSAQPPHLDEVRQAVNTPIFYPDRSGYLPVSVSVGLVVPSEGGALEKRLHMADSRMYEWKHRRGAAVEPLV